MAMAKIVLRRPENYSIDKRNTMRLSGQTSEDARSPVI